MRVSSKLARWVVAASLLALSACEAAATAPSEPAIGRPAGASQGLRAAIVVAVTGEATIRPGQGAPFAAGPDQELLADDIVVTAGDGFVMLELHNGHVVRMRSGEGLRVDQTAAFGEPAAAGALADRLAMALNKQETSDPRLKVAARVAGWNMRMSSAQTFGVTRAPPAEERKLDEKEITARADAPEPPKTPQLDSVSVDSSANTKSIGAPGGGGNKDASRTGTAKGKTPPPPPVARTPDPGRIEPKDSEAKKPSPAEAPAAEAAEPEADAMLDLPNSVDFLPRGGAKRSVGLPGPLKAKRHDLAICAGKGVQIRAQVKGGKLVKLEFPGADKCSAGIIGGTIALEDGWLELRVKS